MGEVTLFTQEKQNNESGFFKHIGATIAFIVFAKLLSLYLFKVTILSLKYQ